MSESTLNLIIALQDNATRALQSINKSIDNIQTSAINATKKGLNVLKSGLSKTIQTAKTGATILTAVATGIAGLGINSSRNFEQMQTALSTSYQGNAEEAKIAFDNIKKFASNTPYQLGQVLDAHIKLKNLGLDPSEKAMLSYGNTASSMGKSLDQMIEAVADASVGEFERLKEFGIRAKQQGDKVALTFQGVTTTISKDSKSIEQYLQNIGNTNFAGGVEAQSKTLNGIISTFKDNIEIGLVDFFYSSGIFDGIKYFVGNFNKILASIDFQKYGSIFKESFNVLFRGDFTNISGLGEDHPFINFLFNLRNKTVEIINIIRESFNVLFKGDFTNISGLGEDHPFINFLFNLRNKTVEIINIIRENFVIFSDEFNKMWTNLQPIFSQILNEYINGWIERFNWFASNVLPFFIEQLKNLAIWAKSDLMPALTEAFNTIWPSVQKFNDMLTNLIVAIWPVLQPIIWAMIELFKFILPPALTATAKIFSFLLDVISNFGNFFAWSLRSMMSEVNHFINVTRFLGETVSDIFSGMGNVIGAGFKAGINSIINYLNSRIDSFNSLIDSVRQIPNMGWIPKLWRISAYAKGGIVGDSNMQLVGEKGAELVNLPSGSKVTRATETNKLLDNKQTVINININANSKLSLQDIREMKDILIRELTPAIKKLV